MKEKKLIPERIIPAEIDCFAGILSENRNMKKNWQLILTACTTPISNKLMPRSFKKSGQNTHIIVAPLCRRRTLAYTETLFLITFFGNSGTLRDLNVPASNLRDSKNAKKKKKEVRGNTDSTGESSPSRSDRKKVEAATPDRKEPIPQPKEPKEMNFPSLSPLSYTYAIKAAG